MFESIAKGLQSAWHGLGKKIDQAATGAEALKLAELDGWQLQKIQAYIDFNSTRIPTDNYGIVRGDTGDYLGSVGSRYKIVSNEHLFQVMDDIVRGAGARYDTAGALGKGETVWMLANMPEEIEVAPGDTVKPYILCTSSHDGTSSVRIFPTADRAVCRNTLRIARNNARGKGVSFRHTTNVHARVAQARAALGFTKEAIEQFTQQTRTLARTSLAPEPYFRACLDDIVDITVAEQQVTEASLRDGSILKAVLNITTASDRSKATDRLQAAITRRKELFADILDRYESDRNNNMPAIKGTAWAAYNAVSEHVDHSKLHRGNKDAESRFERVLLGAGDDLKQAAFIRALALAT